jgi:sugar O-acyltransferase (sialic acid O-acetyltransferase NeuD family)
MVAQYAIPDHTFLGFTVDKDCIESDTLDDWDLYPWEDIDDLVVPQHNNILVVVGYREMNHLRAERHDQAMQMGFGSINLIHPSVHLHKSVKIGTGNIILDHASIHPFTEIGDCNFISSNVNIGHGCRIRDNCWINAGVSLAGEVDLGSNCFVGQNAFITDNLDIADETFIGAGAMVSQPTEFGDVFLHENGKKFPMRSRKFIEWSER